MTEDKYPLYGLAIVGSVLAIWAGTPPLYLLFLACPVMMFFMMSEMNGSSRHDEGRSHGESPQATRPGHTDVPRDRIDRIDRIDRP